MEEPSPWWPGRCSHGRAHVQAHHSRADAVSVDVPLLVAMECRVCKRCLEGLPCPVGLEDVDPRWGAARIRNLLAAWHNQLLEVMGAMGMRDVRRLRGEIGRAMFFEDLDREFFSSLGRRV